MNLLPSSTRDLLLVVMAGKLYYLLSKIVSCRLMVLPLRPLGRSPLVRYRSPLTVVVVRPYPIGGVYLVTLRLLLVTVYVLPLWHLVPSRLGCLSGTRELMVYGSISG